ncbi:MAG: hypothetical protein AAGI30_05465 [Planctomycetota bacterium]
MRDRFTSCLAPALALASAGALTLGLAGCHRPFADHYEMRGYTEFARWQSDNPLGSVIAFADGREVELIASDACLPLTDLIRHNPRAINVRPDARFSNYWDFSTERRLAGRLDRLIGMHVDLSEALEHNNVAWVRLEPIAPQEWHLPRGDLERLIERRLTMQDPAIDPCLAQLERHDAYWVTSVLGVQGLRVQFLDFGRDPIMIDDELLELIGAAPELAPLTIDTLGITVNEPLYFAFVGSKVVASEPYFGDSPVRVESLQGEELDRFRAWSELPDASVVLH